jgi:hypothetical protein
METAAPTSSATLPVAETFIAKNEKKSSPGFASTYLSFNRCAVEQ